MISWITKVYGIPYTSTDLVMNLIKDFLMDRYWSVPYIRLGNMWFLTICYYLSSFNILPSQNAVFSSSVNLVLKASSSTALRIAVGEIIPGMLAGVKVESVFHVDAQGNDGVLFEGRNAISLQSRPGLAKIRIGKRRSITCSLNVVRSLTLKRKRIWSSFDFAPGILRQWLKQVNQRLI